MAVLGDLLGAGCTALPYLSFNNYARQMATVSFLWRPILLYIFGVGVCRCLRCVCIFANCLALCSIAAATEAVPPESEAKPAETSGASFWQKLKARLLKAKEVPVEEESQPAVVEPASVPEEKPEKKESKPGIISRVKKSFWKPSEAKSAEPVAAPVEEVEEAEKAPETGESSAPPTEVCRKLFLQTMNILRKFMLIP